MNINIFKRLADLLPPAPLLFAKVLEVHDDDTSTVQLPLGIGNTQLAQGLSQGAVLRVRGSLVPAGNNAFVREGLIESRAPDGDPVLIVIGDIAPIPPGPPGGAGTIPDQNVSVGATVAFSLTPYWTGGFPPNTYGIVGILPPGLSFNAITGVIQGIPTTVGTYPLTPSRTDSTGQTIAQNQFSFIVSTGTPPGAPSDDPPFWIETAVSARPKRSITCTSGRFVIGDANPSTGKGTTQWSDDNGATWNTSSTEVSTLGAGLNLVSGNGVVVADVFAAGMAASVDGDGWVAYPRNPIFTTNGDIWFEQGEFYICGETQYVCTLNGKTVNRYGALPTNRGNTHGAYGAGVFVAIGSAGACYSTDSALFTAATTPGWIGQRKRVAFGNDGFVAVGTTAASVSYSYTLDGITWVIGALPSAQLWCDVIFTAGQFYVIALGTDAIIRSPSAAGPWAFVPVAFNFLSSATGFDMVATNGQGKYVAVRKGTDTLGNINVDPPAPIPLPYWVQTTLVSRNHQGIAYGNGRFVISQTIGAVAGAYWSADDGVTWNTASVLLSASGLQHTIAFGNGIFAMRVNATLIGVSSDGDVWTEHVHAGLGDTSDIWFANGEFFIGATLAFQATTDGVTTRSGSMPSGKGNLHGTYGNGVYVAIGSSGTCYSSDGITWTDPVPAGWSSFIRRIAFGAGVFVAVGTGSLGTSYRYSTDGITWSTGVLPAAITWREVIYASGRFLAIGDSSENVAVSTDGISWSLAPAEYMLYSGGAGFQRLATSGTEKYVAIKLGFNTLANRSIDYDISPYFTSTDGSLNGVTFSAAQSVLTWVVPNSATFFYARCDRVIIGKKYCEFICTTRPATMSHGFGVQRKACNLFYNAFGGSMFTGNGGCGLPSAGYQNEATRTTDAAYSFLVGDVIGVAFDATTRKLWFSKNGAWISGDPAAGTGETMTIATAQDYYFSASAYSCGIASGTYVYQVKPSTPNQTYPAPAGFTPYGE